MAVLIDATWHDYEIQDTVPIFDESGNEQIDSKTNLPMFETKPTGMKVKLKAFDFETTQRVMILFQKFRTDPKNVDVAALENNPIMSSQLIPILQETLPKHMKDLEGLQVKEEDNTIRNGTIDDFLTHGQMLIYAIKVFLKIFSISNVNNDEKENIKKYLGE